MADAFIELPDPEGLGRPEDHPYNFGFATNMGRLLGAHPRIGPMFQQCFGAIMFEPGALDRREREMVAAVATRVQECFY